MRRGGGRLQQQQELTSSRRTGVSSASLGFHSYQSVMTRTPPTRPHRPPPASAVDSRLYFWPLFPPARPDAVSTSLHIKHAADAFCCWRATRVTLGENPPDLDLISDQQRGWAPSGAVSILLNEQTAKSFPVHFLFSLWMNPLKGILHRRSRITFSFTFQQTNIVQWN